MLQNQIRIDKHKADIEKRITQLETKLRQPTKYSQQLGHQRMQDWTSHQNDRRSLVQIEEYIEPSQVAALRQRELKMKKNNENILIRTVKEEHNNKKQPVYSSFAENQKVRRSSPEIHACKLKSSHILKSENKSQTKELYNIMTEILVNQKNLQRQIGLLRFEWNKQHINKNNMGSRTITFEKKLNQDPDLQNEQFSGPAAFEIINKRENVENEMKQKSRYKCASSARKMSSNKYKKFQNQEAEPFSMHEQAEQVSDEKFRQQRGLSKSNNIKNQKREGGGVKRQKQTQAHQKLLNLIKSQKSRGQRCKVKQAYKSQIWKKVEQRIKCSQSQYRQSIHRNNRHEHEHLINTNELQKKLKDDIIVRIYNQSNNYLYK